MNSIHHLEILCRFYQTLKNDEGYQAPPPGAHIKISLRHKIVNTLSYSSVFLLILNRTFIFK